MQRGVSAGRRHSRQWSLTLLTIRRLQIVTLFRTSELALFQRADERHLEDLHDPVEQPVDDLETSLLVRIQRSGVPVVACFTFLSAVLHRDVRSLEDFERQSQGLVFTQGLEQTGKKRCSDDLEFGSGGVGELDGGALILVVEPSKVLVMRALRWEFPKLLSGSINDYVLTRMSGRTSTHPAIAHSFRTTSANLLIAKGFATVLVLGRPVGRLLNP